MLGVPASAGLRPGAAEVRRGVGRGRGSRRATSGVVQTAGEVRLRADPAVAPFPRASFGARGRSGPVLGFLFSFTFLRNHGDTEFIAREINICLSVNPKFEMGRVGGLIGSPRRAQRGVSLRGVERGP